MQLSEFLGRLSARDLTIVTDHEVGRASATLAGFSDVRLSSAFDPGSFGGVALWLVSSRETQRRLRTLWDGFEGVIAHLLDAKAGGDPAAVAYTLACLDAADMSRSVETRRRAYEQLLTYDLLRVRTGDAELICRIAETVEVACNADALEPGVPYALTELMKASIVNIEAPTSTFRMDGELKVDDLLFQANKQAVFEQHAPMLAEWRQLAAMGLENRLRFADNRMTGLILGAEDRTDQLLTLCQGKEWETNATECAVGVLDLPVECALNTVFSQTRRGLHVGIGMGEQLPFLDFCAPDAMIESADG